MRIYRVIIKNWHVATIYCQQPDGRPTLRSVNRGVGLVCIDRPDASALSLSLDNFRSTRVGDGRRPFHYVVPFGPQTSSSWMYAFPVHCSTSSVATIPSWFSPDAIFIQCFFPNVISFENGLQYSLILRRQPSRQSVQCISMLYMCANSKANSNTAIRLFQSYPRDPHDDTHHSRQSTCSFLSKRNFILHQPVHFRS